MNEDKRADLLKDEYIMLQHFYEDIDSKGLTIKGWSITVALATIGAGVVYRKEVLLVGVLAALVFWYLEAHWRGLSHFFSQRIKAIELVFQSETMEGGQPRCKSMQPGRRNTRKSKTRLYDTCSSSLPTFRTWSLPRSVCCSIFFSRRDPEKAAPGHSKEVYSMSDIKFEIIKKIGVLSTSASGWTKQLNLISWNDRDPKYDIREWSPDGEKMGKGVTLSREELLALKDLLEKFEPFG